MVFLNSILCRTNKLKVPRKYLREGFLDSVRLHVQGGAGGNGLPKYGGVGGKGGDVFVIAQEGEDLKSVLRQFPNKRVAAGTGKNSRSYQLLGERGADVSVVVPVGVSVYGEHGQKLGEVNTEDASVLVAPGGVGGCPATQYNGTRGFSQSVTLDLKLIADVGLVGFPNAGKSTLLTAVSRARPKIASYPFTTIRPNIGVMDYADHRQITVADLPGLIEGAYRNIGMGHEFLKHVERTKMLLLLVDINGFRLSPQYKHRSCLETIILLNKEIELYKEDLLNKPATLVINKMDTEGADEKWKDLKQKLKCLPDSVRELPEDMQPSKLLEFDEIFTISAKEGGEQVTRLKNRIRELLDLYDDISKKDEETFVGRPPMLVQEVGPKLA